MKIQIEKLKDKLSKNVLWRFSLFAITFLIGVIFSTGTFEAMYVLPYAMYVFPAGLIAVLIQNFTDIPRWSLFAGWTIYIGASLVGILAKSRYIFVAIYIIFILLLITNVIGCQVLAPNITKDLN
jgi:hypothetical protein